MKSTVMNLWKETPLAHKSKIPTLTYYPAEDKKSRAAVVVCPGGGYEVCCDYEGHDYALMLNRLGVTAFVLDYRCKPDRFPMPLLDARRAVRLIRTNAEEYGIDADKILIMGSSAGGHLAALTAFYREPIAGEDVDAVDKTDPIPNGQILCYPVIELEDEAVRHTGSALNLLEHNIGMLAHDLTPSNGADGKTPPAFIWSTMTDSIVPVENAIRYAQRLQKVGVPVELHLFPHGDHGMGLCDGSGASRPDPHNAQWVSLLADWLKINGFLDNCK